MQDIQNEYDQREISIDQVGVKDLDYPITIEDKAQGYQTTVARITMSVHLPHQFRGTHMSRFIEILNSYRGFLSETTIFKLLDDIQNRLDSVESYFQAEFPYFIEKKAPVSGAASLMNYGGIFIAEKKKWQPPSFILGARVPLTSLCPCSREISRYGAHNQRSQVTVKIRYYQMVWLEDLIAWIESAASSEIYALLKREDEKFVTEKAYLNPRFVEDIVREIAGRLKEDSNIIGFDIYAEHFESIHNHNVFAQISSGHL